MDTKEIRYFLGIDWGRKKIGLSLADDETLIAFARKEIEAQNFLKEIEDILKEFPIRKIILGISGSEGTVYEKNGKEIERFKNKLDSFGVEIEYEKEFFSSKLAQRNLMESQKNAISKDDNKEAARIILQDWLDRNRDDIMEE